MHHQEVLKLVFGVAYSPAGRSLQVLIVALFISLIIGHWRYVVYASGRTHLDMLFTSIGMVISVVLAIALIPIWGHTGAATAFSISLVATNVMGATAAWRLARFRPMAKDLLLVLGLGGTLFIGFELGWRYLQGDGMHLLHWLGYFTAYGLLHGVVMLLVNIGGLSGTNRRKLRNLIFSRAILHIL